MTWTTIALIIVSLLFVSFWTICADLGPRYEAYKSRHKKLAKKLAKERRKNRNDNEKKVRTKEVLDSIGVEIPELVELIHSLRDFEVDPRSGRLKTIVKMRVAQLVKSLEPEKIESC